MMKTEEMPNDTFSLSAEMPLAMRRDEMNGQSYSSPAGMAMNAPTLKRKMSAPSSSVGPSNMSELANYGAEMNLRSRATRGMKRQIPTHSSAAFGSSYQRMYSTSSLSSQDDSGSRRQSFGEEGRGRNGYITAPRMMGVPGHARNHSFGIGLANDPFPLPSPGGTFGMSNLPAELDGAELDLDLTDLGWEGAGDSADGFDHVPVSVNTFMDMAYSQQQQQLSNKRVPAALRHDAAHDTQEYEPEPTRTVTRHSPDTASEPEDEGEEDWDGSNAEDDEEEWGAVRRTAKKAKNNAGGVSERKVKVEGKKSVTRETLAEMMQRVPMSRVQQHFWLPLKVAAEKMDVSVTTLKRICRKYKIPRWPYRMIHGLDRKMGVIEGKIKGPRWGPQDGKDSVEDLKEQLIAMKAKRAAIIKESTTPLPTRYVKVLPPQQPVQQTAMPMQQTPNLPTLSTVSPTNNEQGYHPHMYSTPEQHPHGSPLEVISAISPQGRSLQREDSSDSHTFSYNNASNEGHGYASYSMTPSPMHAADAGIYSV